MPCKGMETLKSGNKISSRNRLNFKPGANVTLTVADNVETDATDITIAASSGGPGGNPPTGTGFTHITDGSQDEAAKLVANADVDANAAIAQSKVANLPTDLGAKVDTTDARLSDARTPVAHGHAVADTSGLQTALDGKAASSHDHAGVYEPASATIQTHVQSAHAPANAQKNSDITKAEIEAKLTGEISSHTHAGGPGGDAFPVGSVFLSVVSTDPATLLGYGTWAAFAAGRMLVGLDAGDPDFDTAEETGGAKTSAAVMNHTHGVNITDAGHSHLTQRYPTATGGSSGFTSDTSMSGTPADNTLGVKSATTGITAATVNPAGGVASFSIVNPYIVVYAWKRTA